MNKQIHKNKCNSLPELKYFCFFRLEGDSYIQYKAMIISTGMILQLFMFEILVCDKLERDQTLWVFVFIPLIFMSIMSIGICVWAVKHERSFEVSYSHFATHLFDDSRLQK